MDDFFFSGDEDNAVLDVAQRCCSSLSACGLVLSKWISNSPAVVSAWPMDQRAKALKILGPEISGTLPTVKALGVAWDTTADTFTFACRLSDKIVRTVADVLSVLASLYDPLGVVAPYVLTGKQIFQEIWLELKDWRKPVPERLLKAWNKWVQGLPMIAPLAVPHWFGTHSGQEVDLHVFSDASATGYGAVLYLASGSLPPSFVAAKTRVVPPDKRGNIPRLELQAAFVAVRLLRSVLHELDRLSVRRAFLWSDSTTTLRWLDNQDARYEIFIANRVSEIREMAAEMRIPFKHRYVPTGQNPADLASRGAAKGAKDFVQQFPFWAHGPDFLRHPETEWPADIRKGVSTPADTGALTKDIQIVFADAARVKKKPHPASAVPDDLGRALADECPDPIKPTADDLTTVKKRRIRDLQTSFFSKELVACSQAKGQTVFLKTGPLHRCTAAGSPWTTMDYYGW